LVVAHSSALGGLGVWQRRKVKFVRHSHNAPSVDGAIELAKTGLVPATSTAVLFQAVAIAQLRFYTRHSSRKLRISPTLPSIRQRAPIPATALGDDCYRGIAESPTCELLVENS
jgi:hypothetical protein